VPRKGFETDELTLRELARAPREDDYRKRLVDIYELFGGYKYNEAAVEAEILYYKLNMFPIKVVYASAGKRKIV
jgi:hypothetical protein